MLLAGCSVFSGEDAPYTTGSVATPVEIQRPLPPTLAYSDATKIGEAASAVMAQAEGGASEDWVNASTGSSGTIEPDQPGESSADCRPFSTIVTSIGGVHRYSGSICQGSGGRPVVQIDETSGESGT